MSNDLMDTMNRFFNSIEGSFVGYDNAFRHLENAAYSYPSQRSSGYPPYNILKDGDDVRIEIAVAGFDEDEINIYYENGELRVTGEKKETEERKDFLFKGIANRAFERRFTLADTVIIDGASLENGILKVHMHNELPENKRARTIEIGQEPTKTKEKLLQE